MRSIHLVAVGACAIDNILTVPYYPEEDSKLRATSLTRRRGGNCPNSLEVLQQLLVCYKARQESRSEVQLSLIATMPAQNSVDTAFMSSSLKGVDLGHCVFREESTDPVSSYIVSSEANNSRTIINHNALAEMTFDEFVSRADDILNSTSADQMWFHFEGRIPATTLECMHYLRLHPAFDSIESVVHRKQLKISVELEKPRREGLQELAREADVVFYSKAWADGEGYANAEVCLMEQAKDFDVFRSSQVVEERLLVCTWGVEGASAIVLPSNPPSPWRPLDHVIHSAAYKSTEPIVDTTGAGDTFIAAMLYGLTITGHIEGPNTSWSLKQMLDFANGLAGRKVLQQGFTGLAEHGQRLIAGLESERSP